MESKTIEDVRSLASRNPNQVDKLTHDARVLFKIKDDKVEESGLFTIPGAHRHRSNYLGLPVTEEKVDTEMNLFLSPTLSTRAPVGGTPRVRLPVT